jgi:hypothetical protein
LIDFLKWVFSDPDRSGELVCAFIIGCAALYWMIYFVGEAWVKIAGTFHSDGKSEWPEDDEDEFIPDGLRPLAWVRLSRNITNNELIHYADQFKDRFRPGPDGYLLPTIIHFGEIPNEPGHNLFFNYQDKTWHVMPPEAFEEINEDET